MMYQATGYFEQDAHYVAADVSEVSYKFATEPMTAVRLAEQQVSEEELPLLARRKKRVHVPGSSKREPVMKESI